MASYNVEQLREKLEEARMLIKQLQDKIKEITSPPYLRSKVVGFNSIKVLDRDMDTVTISTNGQIMEIAKPEFDLQEGDEILVNPQTSQCMAKLDTNEKTHVVSNTIDVKWSDIGGQEIAKKELQEAIELPIKHKNLFSAYNKRISKGLLMYGPPGCGKTLLAKAAFTSIGNAHGKKACDSGFIYVKGPELLNMYVGQSEANVRELFERARKYKEKHNMPALIFIDEADAIVAERGRRSMSDTVVPMFLNEMDGLDDSSAIVILATNRPEFIDPAIVRDGRIDRKVFVGRPDDQSAKDILHLYFAQTLTEDSIDQLVDFTVKTLGLPQYHMYAIDTDSGTENVGLKSMLSGAMLEGLVDKATSFALHRDIESGTKTGIKSEDVGKAICSVFKQNLDVSHAHFIREIAGEKDIINVRRVNNEPKTAA